MSASIQLENVTFAHGSLTVLDGLTLHVPAGEVLALLGPSGSGKSTLLRILMGLALPERGVVKLAGRTLSEGPKLHVPPEERDLAVVFQDLALWPHLSVADNLAFGLQARGVARAARRERIERTLGRVGLAGQAERRPGQLSGGERQRVAIARALVLEPRAVLLDEPLTNLDLCLRDDLLERFAALFAEDESTVVYVTHDPREAELLGDRVAILDGGRIVFEGALSDVDPAHRSEFARRVARGPSRS